MVTASKAFFKKPCLLFLFLYDEESIHKIRQPFLCKNYDSCQCCTILANSIAIFGKNWYTLCNSNKMGVDSHEERYNI